MKLINPLTNTPLCYWETKEEVVVKEGTIKRPNVRGVWVSTVANIDLPKEENPLLYQKNLEEVFETLNSYQINTVIFQVRSTNDAFYPSKLNPWSKYLTGTEGKNPGFDVFGYAVKQAKKYGMAIHAWMNPYRVNLEDLTKIGKTKEEYLSTLDENNWARLHPEHVLVDGANKLILAPSHQEVIDFVTSSIMEVVDHYDIDGIHIDDYFYPYGKIPEEREQEDFEKRENQALNFDDWRRENVNKMIENIHNELQKRNKKVEFGISPFAIYRTNSSLVENGWEKGSFQTPGALQCYSELYSDVYLWMKNAWIDYVVPQVYFSFERKDVTYHDMVSWWSKIAKETKTKLYIGHGLYQMGANEFWNDEKEMENQLRFNMNYDNIEGSIFFTYHDFVPSKMRTDIPGKNSVKDSAIESIKTIFNQKN